MIHNVKDNVAGGRPGIVRGGNSFLHGERTVRTRIGREFGAANLVGKGVFVAGPNSGRGGSVAGASWYAAPKVFSLAAVSRWVDRTIAMQEMS